MADNDSEVTTTMTPNRHMAPLAERQRLRVERAAEEKARGQGFNHAEYLRQVAERDRGIASGQAFPAAAATPKPAAAATPKPAAPVKPSAPPKGNADVWTAPKGTPK
jgi:hypothetical protein